MKLLECFYFPLINNHLFLLQTARLYCASNVEDVSEVIAHVKTLYPTVPLGVIGVSLGG